MRRDVQRCDVCTRMKQSRFHQTECEAGPKRKNTWSSPVAEKSAKAEKPVINAPECNCPPDMPLAGSPERSHLHHRDCPLHTHWFKIGDRPVDGVWPSVCNCGATKDHPTEPSFAGANKRKEEASGDGL